MLSLCRAGIEIVAGRQLFSRLAFDNKTANSSIVASALRRSGFLRRSASTTKPLLSRSGNSLSRSQRLFPGCLLVLSMDSIPQSEVSKSFTILQVGEVRTVRFYKRSCCAFL
jgi:hypothetical protein